MAEKTVSIDELFVRCVSEEMLAYANKRSEYEKEIAKKGYRLRRGGFERVNWNSTYIAEQYKLCLQKECKEPATVRNLIVHIGDMAVIRMNQIIDACNKAQAEKEKRTTKAKKKEEKK